MGRRADAAGACWPPRGAASRQACRSGSPPPRRRAEKGRYEAPRPATSRAGRPHAAPGVRPARLPRAAACPPPGRCRKETPSRVAQGDAGGASADLPGARCRRPGARAGAAARARTRPPWVGTEAAPVNAPIRPGLERHRGRAGERGGRTSRRARPAQGARARVRCAPRATGPFGRRPARAAERPLPTRRTSPWRSVPVANGQAHGQAAAAPAPVHGASSFESRCSPRPSGSRPGSARTARGWPCRCSCRATTTRCANGVQEGRRRGHRPAHHRGGRRADGHARRQATAGHAHGHPPAAHGGRVRARAVAQCRGAPALPRTPAGPVRARVARRDASLAIAGHCCTFSLGEDAWRYSTPQEIVPEGETPGARWLRTLTPRPAPSQRFPERRSRRRRCKGLIEHELAELIGRLA